MTTPHEAPNPDGNPVRWIAVGLVAAAVLLIGTQLATQLGEDTTASDRPTAPATPSADSAPEPSFEPGSEPAPSSNWWDELVQEGGAGNEDELPPVPEPSVFPTEEPKPGEPPIVHVYVFRSDEQRSYATATTGDLIMLSGWDYDTPFALWPESAIGFPRPDSPADMTEPVTVEAGMITGVDMTGNVYLRACAPGEINWQMGTDGGTITVTGPDLCGMPMDIYDDPRY